jgi:hypothetical protein
LLRGEFRLEIVALRVSHLATRTSRLALRAVACRTRRIGLSPYGFGQPSDMHPQSLWNTAARARRRRARRSP